MNKANTEKNLHNEKKAMPEKIERAQELIKNQDNETLKQLLSANPEISNAITAHGVSLLTFSAYCRNQGAIQLIRSKKSDIDFFESVILGDLELAERYLAKTPALIETFSADGFGALGLACFFDQFKLAKMLINGGAKIDQPSNNDFSVYPIHSACAVSNFEITELLIKRGANVNVKQQSGVTPLHSAAHNGNLEIAKLLIENGADVSAQTTTGQTPLDLAKEKNFKEIMNCLEQS